MALYAIGDLHLSLGGDKPMEIFGPAWDGHVWRLEESLGALTAEDVLVLAGDTSWGMGLAQAAADFRFLEQFPCQKYLVKGNHDYFWVTEAKFQTFCRDNGFTTLRMLHNNCFFYGDYALCGTRGWFSDEEKAPHNEKILRREAMRLETSLKAAGDRPILCFLHYPPLCRGTRCPEMLELLERYGVERCFYGHLHGPAIRRRVEGRHGKTDFSLISADHLGFVPKKILEK